jgi:L-lactate utilization protein LutB
MIQEMTRAHYLGVLCSRCNERIPVPTKTALLYEELKQGEVSEGQEPVNRAMTLRCKACDEESVYGSNEILEFEGSPRVRTSERTRAAKAS